jgi:hypothetical protein
MTRAKITFEEPYSDNSGIEFSVTYEKRLQGKEIRLHHGKDVYFPIETLDWLIDKLQRIRDGIERPVQ